MICKMATQKHTHSLLEENIKIRKEKEQNDSKLISLMSTIDKKLSIIIDILNEVRTKEPTNIIYEKMDIRSIPAEQTSETNMFVPSADTSHLKMNMSDISRKKTKSNISSTVGKLDKLNQGTK